MMLYIFFRDAGTFGDFAVGRRRPKIDRGIQIHTSYTVRSVY